MGDAPLLGRKIKEGIQGSGELMASNRHSKALVVIIVISNIAISVVAHINQNNVTRLVGLHINHFAVSAGDPFSRSSTLVFSNRSRSG